MKKLMSTNDDNDSNEDIPPAKSKPNKAKKKNKVKGMSKSLKLYFLKR